MKKIIFAILMLCICTSAKAGDNKTVSLITSGQGKTQDEAKQNALRNAIEQTFGAFISSHTEIVNDNVVKDEIISVSNGNIEKYEILAEEKLSEGIFSATLSVTISTTKLKTYCKNKGIEIEIDGDTFAANFKLMDLYKKNEEKLISEIIDQFKLIFNSKNPYKFEISASEPRKLSNGDEFIIDLQITATLTNLIYDDIKRILRNTLKSITLLEQDKNFYKNTNLKYYEINWIDSHNEDKFILRSLESRTNIYNFLYSYLPSLSLYFSLNNNINSINGHELKYSNQSKFIQFRKKEYFKLKSENKSIEYIETFDFDLNEDNFQKQYLKKNNLSQLKRDKDIYTYLDELHFAKVERKGNYVVFNMKNILTLEELEKIKKYKIEPIIEKPVIKKQINQEPIINKENTQVTENKPIFKVGDIIEIIGEDFQLGTIFQVIKIENKYFYKITDSDDKLINKLFPEEKLRIYTGG